MKTELLDIIRIWMNDNINEILLDNINEILLVNIKEEFIEEIKEGVDITQSDIIFYLKEIMDMKFYSLVTDIYNIVEFEHYNFDREQDIIEIVAKYISNIIIKILP